MKPKVYVTRMVPQAGIDLLKKECDVEVNPEDRPLKRNELLQNIQGKDGVLCLLTDKIDAEVFDTVPEIKGFANYAVGYDNIDIEEATRRGVPISNTPDVLTDATAEMAWALLFAAARRVVESDAHMRSGRWPGWGPLQFLGGDVTGKTLGIVGAGRIGTAMALKSSGFNMRVLYYDTQANKTLEDKLNARRVDLEELLFQSDFVSVHTPLLPATRHLFTIDTFRQMKSTAYLINTSRGPVIKEADLLQALREKLIAGAGIDVYENEPQMTAGLEQLSNIVITPHTASATVGARTGMATKAATNLLAMVKNQKAPDCVNPDVY